MKKTSILLLLIILFGCVQNQTQIEEVKTTLPDSARETSVLTNDTPVPRIDNSDEVPRERQPKQERTEGANEEHPKQATQTRAQDKPQRSPLFTSLEGCEEKEVLFTTSPINPDAITVIEPQGELTDIVSGHITPGDHIGIRYDPTGPTQNVYALADGYLVRVEKQPRSKAFGTTKEVDNYHLYFEYSCSLFSSYVHVTEISKEVVEADAQLLQLTQKNVKNTEFVYIRVPIKAGHVIGKAEGFGLLGMLTVDTNVTLTGFVTPKLYEGEPWKIHAVPPFEYFTEPTKTQLRAKNPRTKEPKGGKIDFDEDGKLVGNWFLEGTDYAGDTKGVGYCGEYLCPYWNTHLAFVYDFVDPDQVRISIGYDTGITTRGPYGVANNAPNPKSISVDSGTVAYHLVALENRDADAGIITQGKPLITKNTDTIVGTVLVKMIDNRTIKIEIFPENTGQNTFSEGARIYKR